MTIAIIANPEKYAVHEPLELLLKTVAKAGIKVHLSSKLYRFLEENNHHCLHPESSEMEAIKKAEIIVSVGGDGTMLYTAQLVKNLGKPILGINCGRLGFMANISEESIEKAVLSLLNNDYHIENRSMLSAVTNTGKKYHALNEFLFTKKDTASLISMAVEFNGQFINRYWCDGLIISTPTGSTAYNLSSGGPIVMPDTPVMIVTPISPHTLTTRPLVLPSDQKLTVIVDKNTEHILFSYDGKLLNDELPERVDITKTEFSIRFIQLQGYNYFETLRKKLMWGLDHRQEPE